MYPCVPFCTCVYVFVSFNIIKIISLVVDPFFRFFFLHHLNVYVIFVLFYVCFSVDYEYIFSVPYIIEI